MEPHLPIAEVHLHHKDKSLKSTAIFLSQLVKVKIQLNIKNSETK